MFFGLGCGVTFPGNFRNAPYSFLAAGLQLPPVRVEFPFSLLVPAGPEAGARAVRLIPAWVLTRNIVSVLRSQLKFSARNRARRNRLDTDVFTPDLGERLEEAASRLERIRAEQPSAVELDLGDLRIRAKDLETAVASYRRYARFARLRSRALSGRLDTSDRAELEKLVPEIQTACRASRSTDFSRGQAILDDYQETHGSQEEDELLGGILSDLDSLLEA
jgi:hypothetical protein